MTRVGGRAGALVRAGVEKDSAQVGIVAKGTVVELGATAEAADGTARVELVAPMSGWGSAAQLVSSSQHEFCCWPRAMGRAPHLRFPY